MFWKSWWKRVPQNCIQQLSSAFKGFCSFLAFLRPILSLQMRVVEFASSVVAKELCKILSPPCDYIVVVHQEILDASLHKVLRGALPGVTWALFHLSILLLSFLCTTCIHSLSSILLKDLPFISPASSFCEELRWIHHSCFSLCWCGPKTSAGGKMKLYTQTTHVF